MADARETALKVLLALRHGAWSDGALRAAIESAHLEPRDAGLCTALCYGVLQNRIRLDDAIARYSSLKLQKIAPTVMEILRLGVYQIAFLDRVPDSAAVNESVKLAKRKANPRAAGFINAILRKAAAEGLPEITISDPEARLSVEYSHPQPLVHRFIEIFGLQDTEKLLAIHNAIAPAVARLNPLCGSREEILRRMTQEGMETLPAAGMPYAVEIRNMGNPEASAAFREGLFTLQDTASQLCVLALDPQPGEEVLDLCAAPGGKSFAMAAQMQNQGRILSCDLYPHKLPLIEEEAQRLGIRILQTIPNDGSIRNPMLEERFDRVLADVPCSGLGVIRKKPDIRYKDLTEASALPALQLQILECAADYVKPGGVLVYSTCTLLPEENQDVVQKFLQKHHAYVLEPFTLPVVGAVDGQVTLLPHIHHTDGFFIAKFRRKA